MSIEEAYSTNYERLLKLTGDDLAAKVAAAIIATTDRLKQPAAPVVEPELLTVAQAAAKYSLGKRTVYRLIEQGMPVSRIGRAVRIKPKDLQRCLADLGTRLR